MLKLYHFYELKSNQLHYLLWYNPVFTQNIVLATGNLSF